MAKPSAFMRWPKNFGVAYGPYRAVLDRWLDADTGLFWVDLGFDEYHPIEIRLLGYSSPESDTPEGKAATAYANQLAPAGSRVRLYSDKGALHPTITRWVARIELEKELDYGPSLFAAGHARIGAFEG